jgi:endonuclease/exonuclease/phosphatase family metal-dependent hydrolase
MSCEKVILNDEINAQVFINLKLKHKPTEKYFHLVCLHLKAKEQFHEKRHEQIKHILKTFKIHIKGTTKSLRTHPLLICGDFNGEPFENFYSELANDEEIKLEDAYTFDGGLKESTTIKLNKENGSMIKRAIDYIFYNPKGLKLTGYFNLPKENQLIEEQGLPNLTHSSDHLSLIADFKFLSEIF